MGLSLPFHKWGKRGTREQLARGAKQVPGRAQGTVGMWNTHEKQNARWEGEALRQLQPPYPIPEKSQRDTLASAFWSVGSRAALSHQRPTQSQNQTSTRYHSGLPLQITHGHNDCGTYVLPYLGRKNFSSFWEPIIFPVVWRCRRRQMDLWLFFQAVQESKAALSK